MEVIRSSLEKEPLRNIKSEETFVMTLSYPTFQLTELHESILIHIT